MSNVRDLALSSENYTLYDPEASKHPYYAIAVETINMVYQRFPAGAINQKSVSESAGLSTSDLSLQLEAFSCFGREVDQNCRPEILAEISETLDRANCGIMTSYAIGYLLNKYPKLRPQQVFVGNEHTNLSIGRKPNSNKNKADTWDSLICDPWAKQIYRSSQFDKVRLRENILFYRNTLHPYLNKVISTDLCESHYLNGNPEIEDGEASTVIDGKLKQWVEADTESWMRRGQKTTFKPSRYVAEYRDKSASLSSAFDSLSFDFSTVPLSSLQSTQPSVQLSPIAQKHYSPEEKNLIRDHLALLTGYESNRWKASTKDGSLKLYLTLNDPATVLKLKVALNKTDKLKAQERTEKGAKQACILELINIKTEQFLKIKSLTDYQPPEKKEAQVGLKTK